MKSPFTISPFLASGGAGPVFAVNDKIIGKTVWRFEKATGKHRSEQQAEDFGGMVTHVADNAHDATIAQSSKL